MVKLNIMFLGPIPACAMKTNYILEPDVPGGIGPRTDLDASTHPPLIFRLHFIFDVWTDDPLITTFPCYLVTPRLARTFEQNGISGFALADVEIEASDEFHELNPGKAPPEFQWLKIHGKRGTHDIYTTEDHRLGVSKRVLDLILETRPQWLGYCEDPAA
jgi:hypothetical protein